MQAESDAVVMRRPEAARVPVVQGGTRLAFDVLVQNRWAAGVTGIAVMAGVLMLYPALNTAEPEIAADRAQPVREVWHQPAAADILPSIQIEQRVLVVEPVPPRRAPARPPHRPQIKAYSTDAPRVTAAVRRPENNSVAARAGRFLVGDGRYRPEPFPKPAAAR